MIYGDENTGIPSMQAIMQSINLYVYCGNDSINRVDISGFEWGYIRDFAGDLEMIFGYTNYSFGYGGVRITSGGRKSGMFYFDGFVELQTYGGRRFETKKVAYNDNGRLYLNRTDFYKAMNISYKTGEIKYTTGGENLLISFGAGAGIAYLTKDWKWLSGYATGFGVDAVVQSILDSVNPPTEIKVQITVGEIQNGEFYESILTKEYYKNVNGEWQHFQTITEYNGRYNESIL